MSEARLDRIEGKLDRLTDAVAKLETGFVELATEQRVRDQERANERAELLRLIPTVRELRGHINRLQSRIESMEGPGPDITGNHPRPSLPPMLVDGPTQPGSSMLPAYPDEAPNSEEIEKLVREATQNDPPDHRLGLWDVANRGVGVIENLAKGFIAYQRMWGFIVLGVFGPPGLAVGLAQAWMITHPGADDPIVQPVISIEESAKEEPHPAPLPVFDDIGPAPEAD